VLVVLLRCRRYHQFADDDFADEGDAVGKDMEKKEEDATPSSSDAAADKAPAV
jgi:hypothetical protein